MIDTQLIISHIDRSISEANILVLERIEALEALVNERLPARKAPRRKANPSYADVHKYAAERGRADLGRQFYDNYTAGKDKAEQWIKATGDPVYNWKGTFNTWIRNNPAKTDTPYSRSEL